MTRISLRIFVAIFLGLFTGILCVHFLGQDIKEGKEKKDDNIHVRMILIGRTNCFDKQAYCKNTILGRKKKLDHDDNIHVRMILIRRTNCFDNQAYCKNTILGRKTELDHGKNTLCDEDECHPNTHSVVGRDWSKPMCETSAGCYGRIFNVFDVLVTNEHQPEALLIALNKTPSQSQKGHVLKMLYRLFILILAILDFQMIFLYPGVTLLFQLPCIRSRKHKDFLPMTNEHHSGVLPIALKKTSSLVHKNFHDKRLEKWNEGNYKRLMEINEDILSILHHLDLKMNTRERKRPHSSI